MNRKLDHYRQAAAYIAGAVLIGGLAVLLVDHFRWRAQYPRDREILRATEAAARQDPVAAGQLQRLVEQQTNASLRLKWRQRAAGISTLVAAGSLLLLLRPVSPHKPLLPSTLADVMPARIRPAEPDQVATVARRWPRSGDRSYVTGPAPETVDLAPVAEIVRREGHEPHRLIPLLHAVQEQYRYLPEAVLDELCRLTGIARAHIEGVASFYTRFRTKPCGERVLQVCRGAACHVAGADRVVEELRRGLGIPTGHDTDPQGRATVETVGCLGCCHLAPVVNHDGQLVAHIRVEDLPEIMQPGHGPRQQRPARYQPFKRAMSVRSPESTAADLLTRRNGSDPRIVTDGWEDFAGGSLDAYERQGGFAALAKCLTLSPDEVIDEIERSGLRGRGGGGFPTAIKWRKVRQQPGPKYVVANGDEGDPGAFMDRSIMESAPASVLEGMLIAARAVGASQGIVYVRNEYPLAVRRIRETVARMRDRGYLGTNILGREFAFDVDVVEGAGAFVCGEETALIESVMGNRGTPHFRPPYPAESGLWGCPTLVNNVETLACVPWIVRHGGHAFAAFGTAGSKGTKVFSLAGKVRRGGLVETPMGTTLRQLVDEYGGGVGPGRRFKAVQIGGPSGGCLPAELADTPVGYETLRELGAIMGSGGLVVLDDTDCMVDVARYFLEFTQKESCGHCTFCRIGTRKLLDMLERLCAGKASRRELHDIELLAASITQGSLCGLGKTAPNPVLTTLRYFRAEYEAHLEGRCPAGRCKALISYQVTRKCVGCTLCAQHCPVAAIEPTPYRQHVINADICTRCDACRTTCPEQAIEIVSPRPKRAPSLSPRQPDDSTLDR